VRVGCGVRHPPMGPLPSIGALRARPAVGCWLAELRAAAPEELVALLDDDEVAAVVVVDIAAVVVVVDAAVVGVVASCSWGERADRS
jgi:hypothetical protein